MTRRIRDLGTCLAYPKGGDGQPYHLAIGEFDRLREDWMAGKAFFDGEMHFGGRVTLKLMDVVAIAEVTPASLAEQRANQKADKEDDLLDGLDD